MTKSKLNIITATAVTLGLSLALITAPVSAAKKGKGPRASISAVTVCDISRDEVTGFVNSTEFDVTIRLTDKTSGSGIPIVKLWNVEAWAKIGRGNWDNQVMFDALADGGPEGDLLPIVVGPFNLCLLPEGAKAVNAAATITYDFDSGDDERTIENMCSDDPETDEVEPAGIKLSPADLVAINALCD